MKKHLLNGKLMEMKLKIGWTATDFANYLECSEDEFLKVIKETFSASAAKAMLGRLDQNKKRQNKGLRTQKGTKKCKLKCKGSDKLADLVESVMNKPEKDEEILKTEETDDIKTEEIEIVDTFEEAVEEKVTVEELLAELSKKEDSLRQAICQDEALKVQLITRRKNLKSELAEQRKVFLDLRVQIEKANTKVLAVCSEINRIDSEIPEINTRISGAHDTIEAIQKEISELQKLTIFVYESGEIEIEGPVEFSVPDAWADIFNKLSLEDSLEDLPVKQIKVLARMLAFTATLENSYEVTFEFEALQQIFESFQK